MLVFPRGLRWLCDIGFAVPRRAQRVLTAHKTSIEGRKNTCSRKFGDAPNTSGGRDVKARTRSMSCVFASIDLPV